MFYIHLFVKSLSNLPIIVVQIVFIQHYCGPYGKDVNDSYLLSSVVMIVYFLSWVVMILCKKVYLCA
jgi:hypothetical protein